MRLRSTRCGAIGTSVPRPIPSWVLTPQNVAAMIAAGAATASRGTGAMQRSGDGTLTWVAAGILRTADYSDNTLVAGIKIEPQSTNLTPQSGSLRGPGWTARPGMTVVDSAVTAPDGSTSCSTFAKGASLDGYVFRTDWVPSAATTYTISFYASGSGVLWAKAWDGANLRQSNSIATTPGFKRYSFTFTTGSTVGSPGSADYGVNIDTGVIALFGMQLEVGPVATSYIPTTNAAATRGADVLTIPISSIAGWDVAKGTFIVDAAATAAGANTSFVGANGGSMAYLYRSAGIEKAYQGSGSSVDCVTAASNGERYKRGVAYASGTAVVSAKGGIGTAAAFAPAAPSTLNVGSSFAWASSPLTVYGIAYIPKALTPATLRTLTA